MTQPCDEWLTNTHGVTMVAHHTGFGGQLAELERMFHQ